MGAQVNQSTKLICTAQWFWRDVNKHEWIASGDEPVDLQGLLGPTRKRISIWLPSGKRIICRPGKSGFSFPCRAFHFYGMHGPLKENKIEFFIRELSPGEAWPHQLKDNPTFKL